MDELSRMKEFYEASKTAGTDPFMILPYTPNFCCPNCKSNIWLQPTIFETPHNTRLWLGKTICYKCKEESSWIMNPDLPIEQQSPLMHRPLGYDINGNKFCDKHHLDDIMSASSPDENIVNLWNLPMTPLDEEKIKKYKSELDDLIKRLKDEARRRGRKRSDPEDDWNDSDDSDDEPMR